MHEIAKKNQNFSSYDEIDLFTNSDAIREAVVRYAKSPTIKLSDNPLEYWKCRSGVSGKPWTIQFANIAKKYLTPPPTSADIERLFSIASKILSQIRNRTLPSNAEKQLFLHENLPLLNFQY